MQSAEMAVEGIQRVFAQRQRQRLGGVSAGAGDALQGAHCIALAAAGQLEEGAVRRGLRPGIEEAGGAAVVAA